MSRPLGLVRPLVLLIAVLSLTMLSVAPASASDTSLRSVVGSGVKQWQRESDAIFATLPDEKDLGSRAYSARYAAAVERLDAPLVRYSRKVAAERGSTKAGRRGRKLILLSIDEMRRHYRLTAKLSRAYAKGHHPSKRDTAEVDRLARSSEKHQSQGVKLIW